MRLKNFLRNSLLIILLMNSSGSITSVFSQDGKFSELSKNIPFPEEYKPEVDKSIISEEIVMLDRSYKQAMESGNTSEAERIREHLYSLLPRDMISKTARLEPVFNSDKQEIPESDWTASDQLLHFGLYNYVPGYPRQLNMKLGEDGNLYSVVSYFDNYNTYIRIYKSSNMGEYWYYVAGIGGTGRVRSISISVESRSNIIPDSTRIFVFYTLSQSRGDFKNASLNYLSIRANNTGIQYGQIAIPDSGNTFSEISAVSDGAFYQNATYLGIVCTEADNNTDVTKKIKFFRTIDWCNTWVSGTLNTSFDDRSISAGFRNSTYDSVYIAVERYFSEAEHGIRVLAIPWNPSSVYQIYYLTNTQNVKYERPCLTVKQTNPGNSVLITCTKNNIPVYHFTSDGGASWDTDNSLNSGNQSDKLFTYCSSSPSGSTPFTTCVQTMNGDSINVRRGIPGAMGDPVYKVNGLKTSEFVMPVCELITKNNKNLTIVAFANNISGVYSNQEGIKKMTVYVIPQGLYSENLNQLSMTDTLTIYLRRASSPYELVDSAKKPLFTNSYSNFQFSTIQDGSYYVVLSHRNSVETWSKIPLDFSGREDKIINFTTDLAAAYGDNQIRVDNIPVRYAMYSGDVNRDGTVDLSDVIRINNDAGIFSTGYVESDLTGNSIVDLSDVILAMNNASAFVGVNRP